jgi:2-dehydro-3-deoxygluconokinase
MPELVTLGETMVLLTPVPGGSLEDASLFLRSLGGAESNVAIGAARLGISAGWISRLGKDPFGAFLLKKIRGEGVDTSRVMFDEKFATAVMFKEVKDHGNPNVFYYRKSSAFSQIQPDDLDESYIAEAAILHISGITPTLSESAKATLQKAIDIAKNNGTKISFDPNLRLKLWSIEEARDILFDLASRSDYFLPGAEELRLLFDTSKREEWIEMIRGMGIPHTVVKLGEEGCMLIERDFVKQIPGFAVQKVVDTIGAGDGFAAGFLSSVIKGMSVEEAAIIANAVGARCVTFQGDIEGLPTQEELEQFLGIRNRDIER